MGSNDQKKTQTQTQHTISKTLRACREPYDKDSNEIQAEVENTQNKILELNDQIQEISRKQT